MARPQCDTPFVNKHMIDLENVQKNKKKGRIIGSQKLNTGTGLLWRSAVGPLVLFLSFLLFRVVGGWFTRVLGGFHFLLEVWRGCIF
jgi:hypothetical protein